MNRITMNELLEAMKGDMEARIANAPQYWQGQDGPVIQDGVNLGHFNRGIPVNPWFRGGMRKA